MTHPILFWNLRIIIIPNSHIRKDTTTMPISQTLFFVLKPLISLHFNRRRAPQASQMQKHHLQRCALACCSVCLYLFVRVQFALTNCLLELSSNTHVFWCDFIMEFTHIDFSAYIDVSMQKPTTNIFISQNLFFFWSQVMDAKTLKSPIAKVWLGLLLRMLVCVCKIARWFDKMSSSSNLKHKCISIWYYTWIHLNRFLCVHRPVCCLGTCKHEYMYL